VPDEIEGRPEHGGADRAEVRALAGLGDGVDEGALKALAVGLARLAAGVFLREAVEKVSVFVEEVEVAVEGERAEIGEILDLVGGAQVVRDEREAQQVEKYEDQQSTLEEAGRTGSGRRRNRGSRCGRGLFGSGSFEQFQTSPPPPAGGTPSPSRRGVRITRCYVPIVIGAFTTHLRWVPRRPAALGNH
jgi:hypothetical protein